MFPFRVDPAWYQEHWLTDRPGRRARPVGNMARFAIVVALLAGSVALSRFDLHHATADHASVGQE